MKDYNCPKCKNKLIADIHAPEDGAHWTGDGLKDITEELKGKKEEMRKMDNWWCADCKIMYDAEELGVEYG